MSLKKYWQLSQFQLSRIIKGVVYFTLIKAGLLRSYLRKTDAEEQEESRKSLQRGESLVIGGDC